MPWRYSILYHQYSTKHANMINDKTVDLTDKKVWPETLDPTMTWEKQWVSEWLCVCYLGSSWGWWVWLGMAAVLSGGWLVSNRTSWTGTEQPGSSPGTNRNNISVINVLLMCYISGPVLQNTHNSYDGLPLVIHLLLTSCSTYLRAVRVIISILCFHILTSLLG